MSDKNNEINRLQEAIGVAKLRIAGLESSRVPSKRKELEALKSSVESLKGELNKLKENPNAEEHANVKKNL